MEISTVMKKTIAAGSLPQQQAFNIIEPSPAYISFPQKATMRDASFSSYLKPVESGNNQGDDAEISIFDAQKYFNESSGTIDPKVSKRVSPVNATNVDVINLERISERCDFSSVPRFSSASSSVDGYSRSYRARSFHATPTASSEASWNSQTGLLSNPPGAISVSMRNPPRSDKKKRGSARKWLLGRKCPCSSKKSVQVEEKLSEPRTPTRLNHNWKASLNLKLTKQIPKPVENAVEKSLAIPGWLERREMIPNSYRISAEDDGFVSGLCHHRVVASTRSFKDSTSGFTFPVLNQTPRPAKLVSNGLTSSECNEPPLEEDMPRDSLEVFLPPAEDPIPSKSISEHHRRYSLTFTDDDIASDASSDLFEIESFSTQTTSYPMFNVNAINRRDSLDEAASFNARRLAAAAAAANGGGALYRRQSPDEPKTPSVAPTECYEPSEASIEWSVTTAEGFERGSVANFSEIDDTRSTRHEDHYEKSGGGGGCSGGGGKRRGGNGGLMNCRCEKAVNVGPQPVKCVGIEGQRIGSTTLRHVSSRPPPIVMNNKPPLARSHSARLSPPFAT